MTLPDSFVRRIKDIVGDGGLTKAKADYEEAAETLLSKSFTKDEIIELLTTLYWAAASDSGNA